MFLSLLRLLLDFLTSSSSFEIKSLFRTSSPHKNDDDCHETKKKSTNAKNEKRVREIDKVHADEMLPN